jgi:GntR family transcriptional regulator
VIDDTGFRMQRPGAARPADDLDDNDRVALYVRLARIFRDRIRSGEWSPGEKLPPVPDLCRDFAVAPITVRQALRMLADKGLLVAIRGKGTFVTEGQHSAVDDPELRRAINDRLDLTPGQGIRVLKRETGIALPPELQMEGGQPKPSYVKITKIHLFNETPFALMDVYVDEASYRRFPPNAEHNSKMLRMLTNHGHEKMGSSRQLITISHADQDVARALDYSLGGVMVKIISNIFSTDGDILMANNALYRGDMFVMERVEQTPAVPVIPDPTRPKDRH